MEIWTVICIWFTSIFSTPKRRHPELDSGSNQSVDITYKPYPFASKQVTIEERKMLKAINSEIPGRSPERRC
ncbi:MAG TPA: hypothetical protein VKA34_05430 [Balneolales bacterium]|nr:hypothetical protein [Balneolales bacterium]